MDSGSDVTGPVNLGNPVEHSMIELAQTVTRLCNSSSRIVQVALRSDDPRQRRPDITRARALLDWAPATALEAGLARTIEYFDALLSARGRRAAVQGSA